MQKKIDFDKTYAIALSGGGAKGGYEVGAWKALAEEGLKYNAVSGTSVGALNGALMAMRSLDEGIRLWSSITYSQVMDVNDETMGKIFRRDVSPREIRPVLRRALKIVHEGGFDVTPLRNLLREYIDPAAIKSSDVDLYIVTFSLTDKKEVNVTVKDLPDDEICDMLLASAYFPAFKNEPLAGGKRFTDGGVTDKLPITPLIEHGFTDIIAVRLNDGLGHEKRVRSADNVNITYIEPVRKLGGTLDFSSERSRLNMRIGYYDAKRVIYGLAGSRYYLERTLTEREAYSVLMRFIEPYIDTHDPDVSLRAIHETVIPKLAKEHGAAGDYYDVLIKYVEHTAQALEIPEFRIIKDTDLIDEVREKSNMPV